jgi:hypothetical protein
LKYYQVSRKLQARRHSLLLFLASALDQARAEFWEEEVRRDGIFAALVKGFSNFDHLNKVALTTGWLKNEKRLKAAREKPVEIYLAALC